MLTSAMQTIPRPLIASLGARSSPVLAGLLIMAVAHVLSRPAHAEVRVEGRIDSLRVEVRDASVHEALAALSAKFGLRVHNSAALDLPVSGTYQGSLQHVVARLLAGRDYVATHSAGNMEIRIFGPGNSGNSRPVAGSPGAPVVQPGPSVVPTVAAPAPASNPIVDKGRLIFVPR
jgi:hypothetical protein